MNLTVTATAGAFTDVQSVTAMAIQTYPIVAGGSPVTITTHSAGENAWLTFDGQAGQRIALPHERRHDRPVDVLLDLRLDLQARRHRARLPDARRHERRLRRHTDAARDRAGTGSWSTRRQTASGSMTLTLYDVPADTTATITPGGAPVTVDDRAGSRSERAS